MNNCLNRFCDRMPYILAAGSLVARKGKNLRIENKFKEGELTEVLLAIISFIIDKSIEEDLGCDFHAIKEFLQNDVLPSFDNSFTEKETNEIARYCLLDILQNKGEINQEVEIHDFENGSKIIKKNITLIRDRLIEVDGIPKQIYEPTEFGMDFWVRTREIDDIEGFSVAGIILKEQLKRGHFNQLQDTGRMWFEEIQKYYTRLKEYKIQIRENVIMVDIKDFWDSLDAFFDMILERRKESEKHITMIHTKRKEIRADISLNKEEKKSAIDQLNEAENYIKKSQLLIGKCLKEENIVRSLLDEELKSYSANTIHRFDLKKDIFDKVIKKEISNPEILLDIFKGLFLPTPKKVLMPSLFYSHQNSIKNEPDKTDDFQELLIEKEENEKFNDLCLDMEIRLFNLILSLKEGEYHASQIFRLLEEQGLSEEDRSLLIREGIFFQFFHYVFRANGGEINIKECLEEKKNLVLPVRPSNATFNIFWLLGEIQSHYSSNAYGVTSLSVKLPDDDRNFSLTFMEDDFLSNTITINDVILFVRKEEKNNEY